MQEKHLYEYAVIRIVPKVEREEFINAGIILFCKKEKFIKVIYKINREKLSHFCNDIDFEQLEKNLRAFEKVSLGVKEGGPIAQFDIPSRFRWLTAVRSSVIQTSRPHPGLCSDLKSAAEKLFNELVS